MPGRGKLVAFEGIDGAGKRTQLDLLCEWFEHRGVPHYRISFPRYSTFFGTLVGRYLNGDFGDLAQVNAHLSAVLYAGDRFEARATLVTELDRGKLVVADRYVGSNLAHQGARVPPERRDAFLMWLRRLEYTVYALPEEDIVIYLRVPPDVAHQLIEKKGERDYTEKKRDIHEASIEHLARAAEMYDALARQSNWCTLECWDAKKNALRPLEVIQNELREMLRARSILK